MKFLIYNILCIFNILNILNIGSIPREKKEIKKWIYGK